MIMKKTDSEIQQAVLRELGWDMRIDETEVGVSVAQGVVTLTGTVDSWAKKLAAQEAAHRVAAVLDVANDLKVKPWATGEPTDTEVAKAVRYALEWDIFVPDDKIQSTVTEGGVTLTGTVDNGHQRTDAERAIRNLKGVRWVVNLIAVEGPQVAPAAVRKSIVEALERHADRTADRIKLEIDHGKVTLSGTARSLAERAAIVGAAIGTPGVVAVSDHIRIQP
jgi:osmotically-inducible protein OsmY